MKKIKTILFYLIVCLIFLCTNNVIAADPPSPPTMGSVLEELGGSAGYQTEGVTQYSAAQIMGAVINAFLSILGVIFIILIILAGYNWMTARGDEEKVTKAKDTITRAIIGLIIVIGAFAIWIFVLNTVIKNR